MKKLKFLIACIVLVLGACSENATDSGSSFDPSVVCPADGMNAYGMPNRGTFVDERNGQEYEYTTIGNQVWMAENLNYDALYSTCYNTDKLNCDAFGRLYTILKATEPYSNQPGNEGVYKLGGLNEEMIDSICPIGWHVPSIDEWKQMIAQVGTFDDQKTALALLSEHPWNGTNECGFSVLLAGWIETNEVRLNQIYPEQKFNNLNEAAYFLSTTLHYPFGVSIISFNIASNKEYIVNFGTKFLASIRCVKN